MHVFRQVVPAKGSAAKALVELAVPAVIRARRWPPASPLRLIPFLRARRPADAIRRPDDSPGSLAASPFDEAGGCPPALTPEDHVIRSGVTMHQFSVTMHQTSVKMFDRCLLVWIGRIPPRHLVGRVTSR